MELNTIYHPYNEKQESREIVFSQVQGLWLHNIDTWWENSSFLEAIRGFPGGAEVKGSACNVGALGSILGSGRSPGEGNGNPLQYSCLENPMDGGAWWATAYGWQSDTTEQLHFHFHFEAIRSIATICEARYD